MYKRIRRFVDRALSDETSRWYFPVNNAIAVVILISTLLIILETTPTFGAHYSQWFRMAEYVVVSLFAVEYLLRLWSAQKPLRYATSFFGGIDLLSILPGLVLLLAPGAIVTYHLLSLLRLLRILRLLRTLRLVRFIIPKRQRDRFTREMQNGLSLINLEIYFFALATVVMFSGTLMYVTEGGLPNSDFTSIPDGLWWALVTVTTVGYGDMVPITAMGKMVAAVTMIAGLGLFVLMLTVVGRIMQVILFGSTLEDKS